MNSTSILRIHFATDLFSDSKVTTKAADPVRTDDGPPDDESLGVIDSGNHTKQTLSSLWNFVLFRGSFFTKLTKRNAGTQIGSLPVKPLRLPNPTCRTKIAPAISLIIWQPDMEET